MLEQNKKIIIASFISLVLILLIVGLVMKDNSFLKTSSIKTILSKKEEIAEKEADLVKEKNTYNTLYKNLETAEASFEKEKAKYDAISDDTISIIRESNTEENYSLEYMWIKLGNYARKNNLSLIMIEPGNSNSQTAAKQNVEEQSVVEEDKKGTDTNTTSSNNSSGVLKIEVTGSYMDLSDFVFEVENDNELKFKLDNLSMTPVSGTTIKTTFDVKNIIINK